MKRVPLKWSKCSKMTWKESKMFYDFSSVYTKRQQNVSRFFCSNETNSRIFLFFCLHETTAERCMIFHLCTGNDNKMFYDFSVLTNEQLSFLWFFSLHDATAGCSMSFLFVRNDSRISYDFSVCTKWKQNVLNNDSLHSNRPQNLL